MTPIKWLIIAWFIQTILLLILIGDLHGRLNRQRSFFAALTTLLDMDIEKVFELADKIEIKQ